MVMLQDVAPLLLDAIGPWDAAHRTMNWLMSLTAARSVALYSLDEDRTTLRLLISTGADEDTLSEARALWASRGSTTEGEAFRGEHSILVPTRPVGTYIYADGIDPKRIDAAHLADGAGVAAAALSRSEKGFERSVQGRDRSGLKKAELVATLRLHEWNIARVARAKGVTRKTIYDWLAKYDIPREHIDKA